MDVCRRDQYIWKKRRQQEIVSDRQMLWKRGIFWMTQRANKIISTSVIIFWRWCFAIRGHTCSLPVVWKNILRLLDSNNLSINTRVSVVPPQILFFPIKQLTVRRKKISSRIKSEANDDDDEDHKGRIPFVTTCTRARSFVLRFVTSNFQESPTAHCPTFRSAHP